MTIKEDYEVAQLVLSTWNKFCKTGLAVDMRKDTLNEFHTVDLLKWFDDIKLSSQSMDPESFWEKRINRDEKEGSPIIYPTWDDLSFPDRVSAAVFMVIVQISREEVERIRNAAEKLRQEMEEMSKAEPIPPERLLQPGTEIINFSDGNIATVVGYVDGFYLLRYLSGTMHRISEVFVNGNFRTLQDNEAQYMRRQRFEPGTKLMRKENQAIYTVVLHGYNFRSFELEDEKGYRAAGSDIDLFTQWEPVPEESKEETKEEEVKESEEKRPDWKNGKTKYYYPVGTFLKWTSSKLQGEYEVMQADSTDDNETYLLRRANTDEVSDWWSYEKVHKEFTELPF